MISFWQRIGLVLLIALLYSAALAQSNRSNRITPVVQACSKAAPAVVNISSQRQVTLQLRLFGTEDDPFQALPAPTNRTVPATSLGSGFVIHPEGYVVTNAHVIARSEKISVIFADKKTYSAHVVAVNSEHDLAVLKLEDTESRKFPFLPLGRSDDLMIGETVIAIGNPMGLQNTCTTGVLSATNRELRFSAEVTYRGLLQTDAPINPGNSGGPLLNIDGELIGINSAIRADAQGIGFAIASDELLADLPKLLDFERINRVEFGMAVQQRHIEGGEELAVAKVVAGSPADLAGAKVGDLVKSLEGRPVGLLSEYQIGMLATKGGSTVHVQVRRGGRDVSLVIAVKARPKPDGAALAHKLLGLEFQAIAPEMAQADLAVEKGMIITGLEQGGPGERLGLHKGDIIVQLGRFYLTDEDSLGAVLEDVQPGERLRIEVIRGNIRVGATVQARRIDTASEPERPATQPARSTLRVVTRPAGKPI